MRCRGLAVFVKLDRRWQIGIGDRPITDDYLDRVGLRKPHLILAAARTLASVVMDAGRRDMVGSR